jgi:hypothetical protein
MKKRYRVYVVTTTKVPCEVIANSEVEIFDMFEDHAEHFRVVGESVTTEKIRIGQSVPFVEREGDL